MSLQVPRPIDPSLILLATGNYRIATPAIQGVLRAGRVMFALPDHGCTHLRTIADRQDACDRVRAAAARAQLSEDDELSRAVRA